jgi:hypothetical protein
MNNRIPPMRMMELKEEESKSKLEDEDYPFQGPSEPNSL